MSNVDKEIEIQVRVKGVKKLEAFLKTNAKFKGEKYQKDEYYSPAHRNFLDKKPVSEWLRLRQSGSDSITYKQYHYDKNGQSEYCDEYETNVEKIDQLRKIFTVLDIKPIAVVEKTRRLWDFNGYEVAIDKVTDLGDFVEVEYKGDNETNASPSSIKNDMIKFLKEVGCTDIEKNSVGYPYMILYPNEQVFEKV